MTRQIPVAQLAQRAQALHRAGRLEEAVAAYESLIERSPRLPEAHSNLGVALKALGQLEAARARYEQALSLKPDYAEAYNNLGNVLQDLGEPGRAMLCYEQALALKPDYRDAANNWQNAKRAAGARAPRPRLALGHIEVGLTLHAHGRVQEAIAHFLKARALVPRDRRAHICLGNAAQALGQTEEAAQHYAVAVHCSPDDIVALNNLGIALQLLGKPAEAETHHRRALAIAPGDAFTHTCLANALSAQQRPGEAEEHYRAALAAEPGNISACHNLGTTLVKLGRPGEAIPYFEQALAAKEKAAPPDDIAARRARLAEGALLLVPEYARIHAQLGALYDDAARWMDAANQYEQALAIRSNIEGVLERWAKMIKRLERRKPRPVEDAEFASLVRRLGLAVGRTGDQKRAATYYRKAIRAAPDDHVSHNWLGNAMLAQGRTRDAVKSYRKALKLKPDYAGACNNLGMALTALRKEKEAAAMFRRAIEIEPDFAEAHNNLGQHLLRQNRVTDAIRHFEKAREARPTFANAHHNLGLAMEIVGKVQEAIQHYKRALELNPDHVMSYLHLGSAMQRLGRMDEALANYDKALALKPDSIEGLLNKASALYALGRIEEGIVLDQKVVAIAPDISAAYRHLAMAKPESVDEKAVRRLLDKPDITDEFAMNLYFSLGELYRARKDHDQAFEFFEKGNRAKRATIKYDPAEHSRFIDRVIETFSEEFMEEKEGMGSDSEVPVFIVGMPRSGTTLVEQILSSHPEVHGAGELQYLHFLELGAQHWVQSDEPYPECMKLLERSVVQEMAKDYLWRLRHHSPDARHVTDKLPGNFLRLGLIGILFPRAHIIHCVRDPVDTCLSIYMHWFKGNHPYAYDLTELGRYYLDYQRLMKHWESLLGDRMLTVRNEDLVADQEGMTRRMLTFLGLPWDPRCLEFYRNERPVMTASNFQVRKPIFTDSIRRWERYRPHLGPLLEVLGV